MLKFRQKVYLRFMDLLRSKSYSHISKIRGLCLIKCSIEMLQNLVLVFLQMNSLVNVDKDQAIGYHIPKVWQIMKHFAPTFHQA